MNDKLLKAAKVIGLSPATREWLVENDPKALEQLDRAIADADPGYIPILKRVFGKPFWMPLTPDEIRLQSTTGPTARELHSEYPRNGGY